jgi:hypothetical protein
LNDICDSCRAIASSACLIHHHSIVLVESYGIRAGFQLHLKVPLEQLIVVVAKAEKTTIGLKA